MLNVLIRNTEIIDRIKTPRYNGGIAIEGEQIVAIDPNADVAAQTIIDAMSCVAVVQAEKHARSRASQNGVGNWQ